MTCEFIECHHRSIVGKIIAQRGPEDEISVARGCVIRLGQFRPRSGGGTGREDLPSAGLGRDFTTEKSVYVRCEFGQCLQSRHDSITWLRQSMFEEVALACLTT